MRAPDDQIECGGQAPHHLLWAKSNMRDKKPDQEFGVHRLLYHLIDVGHCAAALWDCALPTPLKQQMADGLGLSMDDAGRWTAFLAACHDLGKASPVFQYHWQLRGTAFGESLKWQLQEAGFEFPESFSNGNTRHEVVSTWALEKEELLLDEAAFPLGLAARAAQALGGHHGMWPSSSKINHMTLGHAGGSLRGWVEARRALVKELVVLFQPPAVALPCLPIEHENALLVLISAIVSVADWIGSDDGVFGYCSVRKTASDYARATRNQAHDALVRREWKPWPAPLQSFEFKAAFEGKTPKDTQTQVLNTAAQLTAPALVILEAPMGSGKTEAALSLYAHWAQAAGARGLYIAMPTTATSNQMHERVGKFLRWFYGEGVNPMLVHSRAALQNAHVADSERVEEDEHCASDLSWFLPRKKSLLFPFGVGTVDQALMSVLQTKHFFVRLLGLSHKVVVFDEVHAYDAYMNTLFKRLLEWLHELGASVIVLSATLPKKTRQELLRAFNPDVDALPEATYPRLTLASNDRTDCVSIPPPPPRTLRLEWIRREETEIIHRLRKELAGGGCAVVICNTVKRAQDVYQAIEQVNAVEHWVKPEDLILFHARYPFAWRDEIEMQNVMPKFGPPDEHGHDKPERPEKAIVVATQVVEQSLDLDFDIMISDFAPADLLLQRAGRLHRHKRESRRPLHLDRLLIAAPPEKNDLPQFDRADKYVYAEYVLLRSWLVLKRQGEKLTLPDEVSDLIEGVYGEEEPEGLSEIVREALGEAKEAMDNENKADIRKARRCLARKPDDENLLWESEADLEEDNPEVSEVFQALTRADRPGLSLVCLHQTDHGLALEPESDKTIDPYALTKETVLALTRFTVTVNRPAVMKHLSAQDVPSAWNRSAALRYHRLVVFANGTCPLTGTRYTLKLTRKLGLEILKETP